MTEAEIHSRPYALTKADYIAYYLSTYLRGFVTFPAAVFMWLAAFGPGAAWVLITLEQGHHVRALLIALGVAAVWFGVLPALGAASLLGNLSKVENAYKPRKAIVSGASFTIEGHGFADRRAWSQFRKIIVTRRLIYLSTGAGTAMVVAKSAFATRVECGAFVTACRRHIAGARDRHARVFEAPIAAQPVSGGVETPPFRLGFGLYSALFLLTLRRGLTRPAMAPIIVALAGFTAWSNRAQLAAGNMSSLIGLATGAAVWVALFIPSMTLLSWLLARNRPIMRNPRRLAITAEQLRTYGEGFDVAVNWSAIRRIDRRFGAIQFWTAPACSVAVPLSAFASPDDARAFQDQATAWWQKAG